MHTLQIISQKKIQRKINLLIYPNNFKVQNSFLLLTGFCGCLFNFRKVYYISDRNSLVARFYF